ncbi:MAG: bifunctional demethylmenaquinone methyltransferase/2-methoxy-6-polyprenyl-1,4-benzoquinol methylase UbiE [Chlamydiae bacterium]|nr:bifunctional demethylmenaquinone methyltransferase/2-methoxy-6-polyprenyl-1,4-benzoquinol methylase UbiE [Chlamydiota bacterium]
MQLQADPTENKEEVWKMFDQISSTYDTVNRAMTGGLDIIWRKNVARLVPQHKKIDLLDLATGTGDQIISILQVNQNVQSAVGIDMSQQMLNVGIKKMESQSFKDKVSLHKASALDIPYPNESFDCVTMSFGIRNVTSPSRCLQEIFRVLKPFGKVIILESSMPSNTVLRSMHLLYLRKLLPKIGGFLSRKRSAYVYLNKTIESFPYGKEFCNLLEINKFSNSKMHPQLFGAVTIYEAEKIQEYID